MARILVVEDNDPVRWTLAALLRSSGHDVDQAANGKQALACFADRPTDMVLMDLHMPVMDGLEACQRLRKESQVPILMISTLNSPTIQEQVLECGANGFIPKPLEFDALLGWVRDVSEGSGPPLPPTGSNLPPSPGPALRPPGQRPPKSSRHAGSRSLGGTAWQRGAWSAPRASPSPHPLSRSRRPVVQQAKQFDLSPPFEYTMAYGA